MSETPTPGTVSFSPWWVLLIVPIGLLVGWFVAVLPIPVSAPPPPKDDPHPRSATVAALSESAPGRVATRRRPITEDGASGSQPELEKSAQEPQRAEISQWTSLESALAESRRNGKAVLIDFNAEWCPPCQRMKQLVFDDSARGQAVQAAVIPVSIVDRAREDGSNPPEVESLQRQYGIQAFPTLVVFSPATGRSLSKRGFGDPEATLAWITSAALAVR